MISQLRSTPINYFGFFIDRFTALSINKVQQIIVIAVTVLLSGIVHSAPDRFTSLNDAIEGGGVSIGSVTGTGGSSGLVLNAVLTNETARAQRILVHLGDSLFFRNRGQAQNMIATRVYERGGRYLQQRDGVSYVEVAAESRLPVTFLAYCADFEKNNPSTADAFDVVPLPQHVVTVMRQIRAYETANRDVDTMTASQLALWVAQGHTLDNIGDKFAFDARDQAIMYKILAIRVD